MVDELLKDLQEANNRFMFWNEKYEKLISDYKQMETDLYIAKKEKELAKRRVIEISKKIGVENNKV